MKQVTPSSWNDIYFSSHDNLRLYARHYPASFTSPTHAVLCLPGLTRNVQDFHSLAVYLSTHSDMPRDVYCVDYRGRGRSQYDNDWRNYSPLKEAVDVIDLCTILGLHKVTVIGTSRGGILAMILACMRPTLLLAVVLNDIGPVIERDGLLRLRTYVGSTPTPKNWQEAAKLMKSLNAKQFPKLNERDWQDIARQLFLEDEGYPLTSYDADLAKTLSVIDFSQDVPTMWPQFKALAAFPLLTLRGELSDILSSDTLQKMQQEVPAMQSITVKDQGHAPLLQDGSLQSQIFDFINSSQGA
ncbi:MAG: alpha/beta hydrolase [Pseudomonadota bacterium]